MTDLALFLEALFPGDHGYMELRALPSRARTFLSLGDGDGVAAFVAAHRDEHVYIGVASRRTPTSGTLDNCFELWVAFADLDFAHHDEADLRTQLATSPIPPHLIVHSGGGLHVYWALREPFLLPTEAARATSLLRRIALTFQGDLASAEPARVLRVPGSVNVKPIYTPPREVRLEYVVVSAHQRQ